MFEFSQQEVDTLFSKINDLLPRLTVQQYSLLAAVFRIANDIIARDFDQVEFRGEFDRSYTPFASFSADTTEMILAYTDPAAVAHEPDRIVMAKPPMIRRSISTQSTDSDE